MKKALKIILITVCATPLILIALGIGLVLILDMNCASTPEQIARRVRLKLPEYEIIDSFDNLDRTASAWTCYDFDIEFKQPQDDGFIDSLKSNKYCTKEDGKYFLQNERDDSWFCIVVIDEEGRTAHLSYSYRDFFF